MKILGISCFYHDAAAALVDDGVIVAAAEEERFSRKKHDSSFPKHAIEFCLKRGGIRAEDLDYVVFYEKPLLKFERILLEALREFPRAAQPFGESMLTWFHEKLWVREIIEREVPVAREKVLFTEHHMSHAASALFCSPFTEAAVLTVDGVGEWTTTATGVGRVATKPGERSTLELQHEIRYPHSLGLLYSAFTAFLGFEVNEGEYKVMGMAPYGTPKYVDKVYELIDVANDGSFALDLRYFKFQHSVDTTFSRKFVELFGESRDPKSEFFTRLTHPSHATRDARELDRNQYWADIASSIQVVTEEILIGLVRDLHRRTGMRNLCMAGGVALNSVANGRILREGPFEDLFVQPAAGDSGGALGAALYAYHVLLGQPRKQPMEHAYLGEEFTDAQVSEFLRSANIPFERFDDEGKLTARLVDDLVGGKVLGWSQGRFEWGPRALGNRSIIADPRSDEMKDIVNEKIKFREPFRPFAPVIREQDAGKFFSGLEHPERHYPARFMLMVLPWRPEMSDKVPAVNHQGTGRLQTVRREWNSRYSDRVDQFGEATGVPVLMNTSFNLRGEPIVTTPAQAYSTFSRSGLDVLVLGRHVVRK
jgi:carbamoyltransferase